MSAAQWIGENLTNWIMPCAATGAFGYIALAGLDRVTVTILGAANSKNSHFSPHRGKHSANALFTFLEAYLPADTSEANSSPTFPVPLTAAIQTYAARATAPGPVIIISDLFEPVSQYPKGTTTPNHPITQSLNSLAAKGFEITILHILSPDEVNPELSGDLKLLDSESGSEVEITADYDLLQRYRKGLSDWQTELRSFCGIRGMHYVPVETSTPLEELLFAWMRQYSVLK